MSIREAATRAGGIAATLVLVAGCVSAGGLTAPPEASSSSAIATPIASASDGNCFGVSVAAGTSAPYTIASLAAEGKVFVVGEVTAIEPAMFNTADGKKPPGWGARSSVSAKIVTPVVLQVEQVLRGEIRPGEIRVLIWGGTVGCWTMTVDVAPRVELGQRYVFILTQALDANGKNLLDLQEMKFAWTVDSNDVVQTHERQMSVASLAAILAQASPAPTS
jgi:hypothetical protein